MFKNTQKTKMEAFLKKKQDREKGQTCKNK